MDLNTFIKSKLGDEFKSLVSIMEGHLTGVVNGQWVNVTYEDGESCILISNKQGQPELVKLVPVFQEYFGAEPICGYDLSLKGSVMPTIEWNSVDPEGRILAIIDGSAFPEDHVVSNINLFKGRQIGDYLGKAFDS